MARLGDTYIYGTLNLNYNYIYDVGYLGLASDAPYIQFDDTAETDPAGEFQILSDGDYLLFQGRNSGDTAFESTFRYERLADGGTTDFYGAITLPNNTALKMIDSGASERNVMFITTGDNLNIGTTALSGDIYLYTADDIYMSFSDSSYLIIDNSQIGATYNSPALWLRGNYYDTSDHGIRAEIKLIAAANPYIQIAVDDDGATPSLTNVLWITDNSIVPAVADTVDLGTTTYEFENLYMGTGKIYFYTDQQEWIYSSGTNVVLGAGGDNRLLMNTTELRPNTNNGMSLGHASYYFDNAYVTTLYVTNFSPASITVTDHIFVNNSEDVGLSGETGGLIIGMATGGNTQHIAIDGNEIMSKTNATTAGTLNLQVEGGTIITGGVLWHQNNDIILDNTTVGSTSSSYDLILRGNYYDGTNYLVEAQLTLVAGIDPYLRVQVDDTGTTGTLVDSVRFYDSGLLPGAANTHNLGGTSYEWNNIYVGTGRLYFYTDQAEWVYSNGSNLAFGAGGATRCRVATTGFEPFNADTQNLGGSANEWKNIYIGTGYLYFYTDQQEWIYSDGNAMIFGAVGANQMVMNASTLRPNIDAAQTLGTTSQRWSTLYVDTIDVNENITMDSSLNGSTLTMGGYTATAPQTIIMACAGNVGNHRLFFTESSTSYGYSLIYDDANFLDIYRHENSVAGVINMRFTRVDGTVIVYGNMIPEAASTRNLGSTTLEWANLYIGTGRVYLAADQAESIRSDGTSMFFGVNAVDELILSTTTLRPNADAGLDLGTETYRFDDLNVDEIIVDVDDPEANPGIGAGGRTAVGIAGEILVAGDVCYLKLSDMRWWKTDADALATSTGLLAISRDAETAGSTGRFLLDGIFRWDAGWAWVTTGSSQPLFLSNTAGDITTTAPVGSGDIVRVVGWTTEADEIYFRPDGAWVEVA